MDTVLDGDAVPPGGALSGKVHLQGGGSAVEIEHMTLELVARVEAEHEEGESEGFVVFERCTVGGGSRLGEEEHRTVPFSVTPPWETPVSELYGQPLGIVLGVRTELAVAGAEEKATSTRSPPPAALFTFGREDSSTAARSGASSRLFIEAAGAG
ncbi:sporulation protein [Streptomyces sp. NPDC051776]|uniref:sporulation protein n=1 Tax=Streptomyces sp. NPDC051776 TaxID=3155414 RepID=UPI003419C222